MTTPRELETLKRKDETVTIPEAEYKDLRRKARRWEGMDEIRNQECDECPVTGLCYAAEYPLCQAPTARQADALADKLRVPK